MHEGRERSKSRLTLASNLTNKSFLFLSNPLILTLKYGALSPRLTFSMGPLTGVGGGSTNPAPGAPNTLGSLNEDWLVEVGKLVGVSGGDDAHPALIFDGLSGSIFVSHKRNSQGLYERIRGQ